MKREEKIAAFVDHIVEECEQEGLTISEVMNVPQQLRFAIERRVQQMHMTEFFKDFGADQESCHEDIGNRL